MLLTMKAIQQGWEKMCQTLTKVYVCIIILSAIFNDYCIILIKHYDNIIMIYYAISY